MIACVQPKKAIVDGGGELSRVSEDRLHAPPRWCAIEMQRHDPAYEAAVETQFETRAFHDLTKSVNTFYTLPPPDRTAEPGIDVGCKTKSHVTRVDVGEAVRRGLLFDEAMTLGDDGEDDAAGDGGRVEERGMEGVEAGEDADDESGRTAHYAPHNFFPFTDNPSAFNRRLRPAGLPRDILTQIHRQQCYDDDCVKIKRDLRRARAAEEGGRVHLDLWPDGGCVRVDTCYDGGLSEFKKDDRKVLSSLRRVTSRGEERGGRECLWFVVPRVLRDLLLEAAHDSMLHLGGKRTLDALRASGMWWPRQSESVKEFCRRCVTCAFNKVGPRHGAMHIPPNGNKPWQIVSVDVVFLEETSSGNSEAVIFSCRFCRSVRAFAVPRTLDSKHFLNIVARALIPDVGVPLMMISDWGSNLISALCMAFYEEYGGTDPRLADANMHTAVGVNERFNHTLREMARAAYFDHKCEWDIFLPLLVLFYRATKQESLGCSPFFLECGREPVLPWHPRDGRDKEVSSLDEYIIHHIFGVHLAWEAADANLGKVELRTRQITTPSTKPTSSSSRAIVFCFFNLDA